VDGVPFISQGNARLAWAQDLPLALDLELGLAL
jgi:hypothetical protein